MQIKTILRYHDTPARMAKIRLTTPNVAVGVEQLKLSYIVGGDVKFLVKLNIDLPEVPAISHLLNRNESLRFKKKT